MRSSYGDRAFLSWDARGGARVQPFSSPRFGGFFTAYSVSESTGSRKNLWGMFVPGCRSWKECITFLES